MSFTVSQKAYSDIRTNILIILNLEKNIMLTQDEHALSQTASCKLLNAISLVVELFPANQLSAVPEESSPDVDPQSATSLQPRDQRHLRPRQHHLHLTGHQEW